MGRLKDMDHPATGHCALASIGVQKGRPKLSLSSALHDRPKRSISLVFEVCWEIAGVTDKLTLLLKLSHGGSGDESTRLNFQELDEYRGDVRPNVFCRL